MLISGIQLTRSITSALALSTLRARHGTVAKLLRKRIGTRQSEENVHEIRDSKMVTRRCLIKLSGVSTVFAAAFARSREGAHQQIARSGDSRDVRELRLVLLRS